MPSSRFDPSILYNEEESVDVYFKRKAPVTGG